MGHRAYVIKAKAREAGKAGKGNERDGNRGQRSEGS
jgi:hypothetical protein